jgi:hypothetical protein
MNNKNGIKVGFIAAAIALLVVAVAVPAGAGGLDKNNSKHDLNRLLTGDYYDVSSITCAYATMGYNENLERKADLPGYPPSVTQSGSVASVSSYNGHGGWTSKGKSLMISNDPGGSTPPLKSPVKQVDVYCHGDYWVNDDLSVGGNLFECTAVSPGEPYPPGPSDPHMLITGLSWKSQLVGTAGNIVTLESNTEPTVQKVWLINYPGLPSPWLYGERVCTHAAIGMKRVRLAEGHELTKHGE